MMKMLDTTETLFAPADAEVKAAILNAGDDDGWSYVVVHSPSDTGFSFINVFDEDGEFVAKF